MKNTLLNCVLMGLPAIAIVLSSGCTSPDAIRSDGIPHSRYMVGGGYMIKYKAPSPGTAYFVEESSRKIIATQSLDEGEVFDIDMSVTDDSFIQGLERIGVEPDQAKFTLYFVPGRS